MKILRFLFFLLIGILVLFFAAGLFKSSVSYGTEIQVNKPIKEAWAVAEDETKYSQWLEGFKSMELIEGEYAKVGSKYKVIVNPGEGQDDFEMIETVISKKDFDHITMVFDSEMMDFEQTVSYSEADGMTNIKTDSKVMGKGLMARSMFAWMEMLFGAFSAQEAKNFAALKTLIEENTTDYYPEPAAEVMEEATMEAAPAEQ